MSVIRIQNMFMWWLKNDDRESVVRFTRSRSSRAKGDEDFSVDVDVFDPKWIDD